MLEKDGAPRRDLDAIAEKNTARSLRATGTILGSVGFVFMARDKENRTRAKRVVCN